MWVVKMHNRDYDEVYIRTISEHETEAEAEAQCDVETSCSPFDDVWFSVKEE